jgi:hypothetical protein
LYFSDIVLKKKKHLGRVHVLSTAFRNAQGVIYSRQLTTISQMKIFVGQTQLKCVEREQQL